MEVIFMLIGFSVLVAGGFLIAFTRAVKTGQFDDRTTPAIRMLFDEQKDEDISKE
jgi:cbb3-type cytochrome oxidase maturation protein